MIQKTLAVLFAGSLALAQSVVQPVRFPPSAARYTVSVATTALTVQNVANGNQMQLEQARIYCSSASTITQSWGGTAATATAATIKPALGTNKTPLGTAWSGSNVGAGTTGPVDNIPAGSTFLYDMTQTILGTGTINNFTFTTSNSCTITIQWREA